MGRDGEAAGDTEKMTWVHLHGHLDPRFMNVQMVGLLGWASLRGVH